MSDLEQKILEEVEAHPSGTTTETICRRLSLTPQDLGEAFEALLEAEKLKGFGGLWMTPSEFETQEAVFLAKLEELHAKNRKLSSLSAQKVAHEAGLTWAGKVLDRITSALEESGALVKEGLEIRTASFKPQLTKRQRAFLDRVVEELGKEEVNTPNPHELGLTLSVPQQAVEEILRIGRSAGELIQLDEVVFYTPTQLEDLKGRLSRHFGSKPFSPSDFREFLGATRKYANPLLEYFEQDGFLEKKEGDWAIA